MSRIISVALLCLFAGPARDGAAQSAGTVSVTASVGGKSYKTEGGGTCRHTPAASIYDVPAALWMVQLAGSKDAAITSLNFTLWRPKDGSREQLSLNLGTGSASHRIDVGGRGGQVGTGKASVSAAGSGGRFEIKGKDEKGTAIEVVIECASFAGVAAEGG